MRRNRSTGFTMIELVVIVAVMGLLTGVAFPRLAAVKDTYDVIEAAEEMAADLRRARVEARRRNRAVLFRPATNGRTYTLDLANVTSRTERKGQTTTIVFDTTYVTLASRSFPSATRLLNPSSATVQFNPFGPTRVNELATTAPTTFTVSGTRLTRDVTLSQLGDVIVR